ncbi:MAG: NAD(+) kinase [Pseudomonadota bacterium]
MSSLIKTVGVIGKRTDPAALPTVVQLCRLLGQLGCEVLVDDVHAALASSEGLPAVPRAELGARCQLIVVVGGDGTLLDAGRSLAHCGVPLLGINQGRLGFMVDVRPDEMLEALRTVLAGEGVADNRLLLSLVIRHADGSTEPPALAVNDVVLRNFANIRMLDFETWLGEEFISQHRADGMIVSSPTGSTAYALSGGGPVVHPSVSALTLVPICPHTLSDRPIVVPATDTVRIVLRGPAPAMATVTCDGQVSRPIRLGDSIEVSQAANALRLIHPRNYQYFSLLRDKLHWGRGPSNLSDRS